MADEKNGGPVCANCRFGELKELDQRSRLLALGQGKATPAMVECRRYPATATIVMSAQGPVAATTRPTMKPDETCGEHSPRRADLN